MRRRGVGVGAVQHKKKTAQNFQTKGKEITASNVKHIEEQLTTFKSSLEDFASKYKNKINKEPEFRAAFQKMCTNIGVDPLASNKGFWADILGVGDFYYELGVQIVNVCLTTRPQNGGLITLEELQSRLTKIRGKKKQLISADDIKRAIAQLRVLGSGFKVLESKGRAMIVSVPLEMSGDHALLIGFAQDPSRGGKVVKSEVASSLGWDGDRMERVFSVLTKEGMLWADECSTETEYWFPSIFLGQAVA